jgi:hypothetical protein
LQAIDVVSKASASRPSGEWDDDDYDVLADGVVVGRIMEAAAAARAQARGLARSSDRARRVGAPPLAPHEDIGHGDIDLGDRSGNRRDRRHLCRDTRLSLTRLTT